MRNADILTLPGAPNTLNIIEFSLHTEKIPLSFAISYQKPSHATQNCHSWKPSHKPDGEVCSDLQANEAITNAEGPGCSSNSTTISPGCSQAQPWGGWWNPAPALSQLTCVHVCSTTVTCSWDFTPCNARGSSSSIPLIPTPGLRGNDRFPAPWKSCEEPDQYMGEDENHLNYQH